SSRRRHTGCYSDWSSDVCSSDLRRRVHTVPVSPAIPEGTALPMIRSVVEVRDRVRIHYRRMGAGRGMVLLHGYPQTGHMWRKVMPALAQRFSVLAPDLRGYGDSDRPAT